MDPSLIHISTSAKELGFSSPQTFRITRKYTGGQFKLHRIGNTTMIPVDDLIEWAEHCVRPFGPDTVRRLRLLARPESELLAEVQRG